jgi:hypothetical protein
MISVALSLGRLIALWPSRALPGTVPRWSPDFPPPRLRAAAVAQPSGQFCVALLCKPRQPRRDA